MEIKYTGRHIHVDEEMRDFAASKVTKVVRFLEEPVEVQFMLDTEKHRQIAELVIHHRHGDLTATEESDQMLDAIQQAINKVEKQARRSHKKHKDKKRRATPLSEEDWHWPVDVLDQASFSPRAPEGPKIIKSSRLQIKPMTLEEAALGLAQSKNEFFVFRDSASERINVLYRRSDGNYGLIAPEF